MPVTTLYDVPLRTLSGEPAWLPSGQALLIVNVASKCGLTPQYTGLEALQQKFGDRGFSVMGFPCNQFLGQEPGTAEEIATFCSSTYGVSFPLFEKVDVNGEDRHPLFALLTEAQDDSGEAGDVRWNFEKWLIAPTGEVARRFRPQFEPDDPALLAAVEAVLPAS
jgi:glutathione peroxidase